MAFNPKAVIETERLILRFMRVEDTHDIFVNINHDQDVLGHRMGILGCSTAEMKMSFGC